MPITIVINNNSPYSLDLFLSLRDSVTYVGGPLPLAIQPNTMVNALLNYIGPNPLMFLVEYRLDMSQYYWSEFIQIQINGHNPPVPFVTPSRVGPAGVSLPPRWFLRVAAVWDPANQILAVNLTRDLNEKFETAVEEIPDLTQSHAIGQGFNIFGIYSVQESMITPLFDPAKAQQKEWTFNGQKFYIPEYVDPLENSQESYESDVSTTREDFQNSISVKAKVDAGYGGFSGHMEASYGREFTSSAEYNYAYQIYNSTDAKLSWKMESNPAYLSDVFVEALEALPDSMNDLTPFGEFFTNFGAYFVSSIKLGGSLEYYAAVSKTSQMDQITIGSMLKVEYKGLFVSGGVSTDIKDTSTWKSYSQNRYVTIRASGGDDDFLAQLGQVDPDNPSPDTPNAFVGWVNSLKANPAIVDFELTGIWMLCGSKQQIVQDAFMALGPSFRPQMSIEVAFDSTKPIILVTGEGSPLKPEVEAFFGSGFQVLVLDRRVISSGGIRLNAFYSFDAAAPNYTERLNGWRSMYAAIQEELEANNFLTPDYFIILASFGLPNNAGPTPDAGYPLFRSLGGTSANLKRWADTADFGSTFWENCAYILIGIPGLGADSAIDLYVDNLPQSASSVVLKVNFYRINKAGRYTLGLDQQTTISGFEKRLEDLYKLPQVIKLGDSTNGNGCTYRGESYPEGTRIVVQGQTFTCQSGGEWISDQ